MRKWKSSEARAKLSRVIRVAGEEGPQVITVRGEVAAVLLARADYDRLVGRRESLVEFMRKSPLAGLVLEFERDRSPARPVDL